jgi:hypothetical protein
LLPAINVLSFKTKLISTEKVIEFRPFLAKEQKLLLMALEGGSVEDVTHAVINILKACIITKIDVMALPSFDIQHLFLEIRKKSIGNILDLKIHHPEADATCNHAERVSIDLDNVIVLKPETHTRKIKLTDEIGVVMRYPSSHMFDEYSGNNVKNSFDLIASCIESVYNADEMFSDFAKEEITQWIGNLTADQLQKITQFFETMPSLVLDINYTCTKCKKDVSHRLNGLTDFFT